jgi:hypothetical protein
MIVETKVLKGSGGIVRRRLDIDSTRKRVRLVVVPTVVVRVDVITGGGDGGTVSRHSSEDGVLRTKMMGK